MDEMVACAKDSRFLKQVVGFDGTANHDAELDRIALDKPVRFEAVATGRDDVALLGFTSGTTGVPKATMHFHRDLLIIADGYAKEVLGVTPDDVFVGSPPLAFTFGLGGLAIFPLRFGAAATLLENASPPNMVEIIETYRATDQLHRADRLPRHAGGDGPGRRSVLAAHGRVGRRDAAGAGVRGVDAGRPASRSSTASAPPRCCTSSSPTGSTTWRRRDRQAGHRLRGKDRRRRHERSAARHGRPARRARPDRLPLSRRRAPEQLCPRRLEPDRRFLHRRTRTATSISPRARTT